MSFPVKPIYLLADSQLLFHKINGKHLLADLRQETGKDNPKAAYIGASNGDLPEYFGIFQAAMENIGINDCRMIYADYQQTDRAFLMDADLILLAGGDPVRGWRAIDQTGMGQDILQKYYDHSTLVGISAGAIHLGLTGFSEAVEDEDDLFETFKLVPHIIDAHDEANGWDRLKQVMKFNTAHCSGIGLPTGGGLIYHPDHTIEPLRHPLPIFHQEESGLEEGLLLPPLPEQNIQT